MSAESPSRVPAAKSFLSCALLSQCLNALVPSRTTAQFDVNKQVQLEHTLRHAQVHGFDHGIIPPSNGVVMASVEPSGAFVFVKSKLRHDDYITKKIYVEKYDLGHKQKKKFNDAKLKWKHGHWHLKEEGVKRTF